MENEQKNEQVNESELIAEMTKKYEEEIARLKQENEEKLKDLKAQLDKEHIEQMKALISGRRNEIEVKPKEIETEQDYFESLVKSTREKLHK